MDDFPLIDTSFDFRVDSSGRDPDKYSPTLRRYHQLLWSKPLPSGEVFTLEPGGGYLLHDSDLGYFPVSSDSVTPTFTKYKRMAHLVDQFQAEDNEAFVTLASTVGGVLVFPSTIIDGKQTINAARGFTRKIADRMDLTLECIRRPAHMPTTLRLGRAAKDDGAQPRLTPSSGPCRTRHGSMLVHVVTVLMVPMPVMDVIDMVTVFHSFVPVTVGVYTVVVFVDQFLGVQLTIMDVVDMPVVLDGFVAVAGKVLMITCWVSLAHWLVSCHRKVRPRIAVCSAAY